MVSVGVGRSVYKRVKVKVLACVARVVCQQWVVDCGCDVRLRAEVVV